MTIVCHGRTTGGGSPRHPETFQYGPRYEYGRVVLSAAVWSTLVDQIAKHGSVRAALAIAEGEDQ